MRWWSTRARLGLVALLCAVGLAAAGCGGDDSDSGSNSGQTGGGARPTQTNESATLRIATPMSVATLDPAASINSDQFPVLSMVAESLTRMEDDGSVAPALATDWTISDDGLTYTFRLREGVRFTNGEPFNAEAAKFNLDRLLSGRVVNGQPQTLLVIEEVNVLGEYELEIKLREPHGGLLAALTLPASGMLAPRSVTEAPNRYETVVKPIGTGPYMHADDVAVGRDIELVANPDYWGPKPYYGRQVYQIVPEASSRVALLRSGQVDIAMLPPMTDLEGLRNNPDLNVIAFDSSMMLQVFVNTISRSNPQLRDPEVRKALALAIDRETIIDRVLFGSGALPRGILAQSIDGACEVGDFGYDPEQARQILADKGAAGMKLRMIAPEGRYLQDYQVAQAVAGYLRDVGVDVELANPMQFADYITRLYVPPAQARFDLAFIGFSASFGYAGQALRHLATSSIPPNGFNSMYYSSRAFDDNFSAAVAEPDRDRRNELFCEAQKVVAEDTPSLILYQQRTPLVTRKDIEGIFGINTWYVTTYAYPADASN